MDSGIMPHIQDAALGTLHPYQYI